MKKSKVEIEKIKGCDRLKQLEYLLIGLKIIKNSIEIVTKIYKTNDLAKLKKLEADLLKNKTKLDRLNRSKVEPG